MVSPLGAGNFQGDKGVWNASTLGWEATPDRKEASYLIFIDANDSNKIKALNGTTGAIDYSHATDPGNVIQSCITALASTGGVIQLKAGQTFTYTSTVPAFPKSLPTWLKIIGHGATIKLAAGAPRAFDFNRTADYDTFQYIHLEGFTVDCDNVAGSGGSHVVIGTAPATGGGDDFQHRINIQDVTIKVIKTVNVPYDATNTNVRDNICFTVKHSGAGETTTYIRRITIEDCNFSGGNFGTRIQGHAFPTADTNVCINAVRINRVYHDTGAPRTAAASSANIQIGHLGYGYDVVVSNCTGLNSGDVGIEIDNGIDGITRDCTIIDALDNGFYVDSYRASPDVNAWTQRFDRCKAQRISLGAAYPGIGFGVGGVNSAFGTIVFDGCEYYSSQDYAASRFGAALLIGTNGKGLNALVVKDFTAELSGINHSSGDINLNIMDVELSNTPVTPKLTFQNVRLSVQGSLSGGHIWLVGLDFGSVVGVLDIDGLESDFNISGATAGSQKTLQLGSSCTLSGNIRKLRPLRNTSDTGPVGLFVEGTDTLTIPTNIRLEDCDFTSMSGVAGRVTYDAPSNVSKFIFKENINYLTKNSGVSAQNGTGAATSFTIAHGLALAPSIGKTSVTKGASGLPGIEYLAVDATNITVYFMSAPASGTGNVVMNWNAEV